MVASRRQPRRAARIVADSGPASRSPPCPIFPLSLPPAPPPVTPRRQHLLLRRPRATHHQHLHLRLAPSPATPKSRPWGGVLDSHDELEAAAPAGKHHSGRPSPSPAASMPRLLTTRRGEGERAAGPPPTAGIPFVASRSQPFLLWPHPASPALSRSRVLRRREMEMGKDLDWDGDVGRRSGRGRGKTKGGPHRWQGSLRWRWRRRRLAEGSREGDLRRPAGSDNTTGER